MTVGKGTTADYENLRELFKPHIESFDYLVDAGLATMLQHIKPIEVLDSFTSTKLRIWFGKHDLSPPGHSANNAFGDRLYPSECRQAGTNYAGKFSIEVFFQYNENNPIPQKLNFGQLPIMLKSKLCHLRGADPAKLVSHKEEATEMGGYFILNGLERLVRIVIMPKRNYPTNIIRNSFRDKREGYTDKAVVIRCVREDQSALTVRLYYLQNGSARLGFWIRGREYLLPVGVVLKALIDTNDHEIYVGLTCCYNEMYQSGKGVVGTQLVGERVKIILDEVRELSLWTRLQCLQHIGEYFQPLMDGLETESHSFVGEVILKDYIFVHLESNDDKFNLLMLVAVILLK